MQVEKEAQQLLRNQVIRLRKAGKTYKEISEIVGIRISTACQFYKAYEKGGRYAVKIKKRSRPKSSCRTLTQEQENRLKKAIADKTPDQLKFPFALWTQGRPAVDQLAFFHQYADSHRG